MDLEPIKKRLAAATPGPWRAQEFDSYPGDEGSAIVGGYSVGLVAYAVRPDFGAASGYDEAQCDRDAQFIAHAPTDIAALIAEVEKLKAKLKRLSTLPVVRDKGPHDTDAGRFLIAARNLENGEYIGGSCTRRAVASLIRRDVDIAMGGEES
jgi:hypothetical protein